MTRFSVDEVRSARTYSPSAQRLRSLPHLSIGVNHGVLIMKLTTLEKLLADQLKDLYSAESMLTKALPKMAKTASTEALSEAIENHLEETKGQLERLQQISELMGVKLTGKKCKAMEGLIEEGKEVLEADGAPGIIDAAIIAAAQKVEHYEIGSYGTARTLAQQLGQHEVAELLQETLDEEGAADEKLTEIAESEIYPKVIEAGALEDESEESPARGRRRQAAGQR
jgi:ferritin-like metal-binding protein YciE